MSEPTYDGRCGSCALFGGILCPKDQRGRGAPLPGERRCDAYIPTTAQMRRDVLRSGNARNQGSNDST